MSRMCSLILSRAIWYPTTAVLWRKEKKTKVKQVNGDSSRVIARPLEIRHLLFKSLLCLTAIDSSIPYQGCRGRREEGWDVCHSGIVTEVSPNITINNVTCTRVKLLDHRNLEVRALAQTPAGEREMCVCSHIAYINKGYPPDMATLVLNVHTGNTVCRRCQGGTKKGIA